MTKKTQDWDPSSAEVLRDQVGAYDEMRARCPVARSELLGWSLFKHEDIVQVLEDPQTFSNVVSTRRPECVKLGRDQGANLLWGHGIHVCPGAPLARLEMRIALETLLSMSGEFVVGSAAPTRLPYPENGWASLPMRLRR